MHMQGGSRPDPVAQRGEYVHERNRPEHTARVVRAKGHSVVLEYHDGGRHRFGRGEFLELFERGGGEI